MRTRTGLTPDAWRDDGPATPARRSFDRVAVSVVGEMRPILTQGVVFEASRIHHRPQAFSITGKPKP